METKRNVVAYYLYLKKQCKQTPNSFDQSICTLGVRQNNDPNKSRETTN